MGETKKARELVYDDRGRHVELVVTAWNRKPLPVTFDNISGEFVYDDASKIKDLSAPSLVPLARSGELTLFSFKKDGTVTLNIQGNSVHVHPDHALYFREDK